MEPSCESLLLCLRYPADQQATREAFAFVSSLINMKWQGIEQFILPHVAKYVDFIAQWSRANLTGPLWLNSRVNQQLLLDF
jgi:hypothetical protein